MLGPLISGSEGVVGILVGMAVDVGKTVLVRKTTLPAVFVEAMTVWVCEMVEEVEVGVGAGTVLEVLVEVACVEVLVDVGIVELVVLVGSGIELEVDVGVAAGTEEEVVTIGGAVSPLVLPPSLTALFTAPLPVPEPVWPLTAFCDPDDVEPLDGVLLLDVPVVGVDPTVPGALESVTSLEEVDLDVEEPPEEVEDEGVGDD